MKVLFSQPALAYLHELKAITNESVLAALGDIETDNATRLFILLVMNNQLELSVSQLRHLLGVKRDTYPEFKFFNHHVIKQVLNHLNDVSGVTISVDFVKDNRAVSAVRFTLKNGQQIAA